MCVGEGEAQATVQEVHRNPDGRKHMRRECLIGGTGAAPAGIHGGILFFQRGYQFTAPRAARLSSEGVEWGGNPSGPKLDGSLRTANAEADMMWRTIGTRCGAREEYHPQAAVQANRPFASV